MANMKRIVLPHKVIVLRYEESFFDDIDVDDIIKTDYSNIVGEMLTFPVIMNRIGLLKAEAADAVRDRQLDLEVTKARLGDIHRKALTYVGVSAAGTSKVIKPTKDEVDNAVTQDIQYQNKVKELNKAHSNYEDIESLYWSAKSKDNKLDAFGSSMTPEEFEQELIETTINNIVIKGADKPFKRRK